jgi:hypothetical protein
MKLSAVALLCFVSTGCLRPEQPRELSAVERLQLDRTCSDMAERYASKNFPEGRPYSNHYNFERKQCLIRYRYTERTEGSSLLSVTNIDNAAENTTIAGSRTESGKTTFLGAATSDAELANLMQK